MTTLSWKEHFSTVCHGCHDKDNDNDNVYDNGNDNWFWERTIIQTMFTWKQFLAAWTMLIMIMIMTTLPWKEQSFKIFHRCQGNDNVYDNSNEKWFWER